VQRGNTGATVELAALTAILYLLMSVPLAHLVSRMEQRMAKRRTNAI
jgi:ABC-type amino acid transport system permease subunit